MEPREAPLALVTGGARGYGVLIVRELDRRGMRVAVLARDPDALRRICAEVDGIPVEADVLDEEAVREGLSALSADHGPVSVLVNNAGVGGRFDLTWEAPVQDWWRTMEVNVRGTHTVTSAVVPRMIEAGRGRVINVVSQAGIHRWPMNSMYSVSKAAVIKYGENLAAEVRRFGLFVLNYHPGLLRVGLTETLFDGRELTRNEQLAADWFSRQFAEGRGMDPSRSAEQLGRLAAGEADALSGRYLTAYDDLDDLLRRADRVRGSDALTMGFLPLPD